MRNHFSLLSPVSTSVSDGEVHEGSTVPTEGTLLAQSNEQVRQDKLHCITETRQLFLKVTCSLHPVAGRFFCNCLARR